MKLCLKIIISCLKSNLLYKKMSGTVLLPVSLGEAFDKLSILQLKLKHIKDDKRVDEVRKEYDAIIKILEAYTNKITFYYNLLLKCNEEIWILCDVLREGTALTVGTAVKANAIGDRPQQNSLAGAERKMVDKDLYAKRCIDIIEANDDRFRLKNKINNILLSVLKEQKSYSARIFTLRITGDLRQFLYLLGAIRFLSIRYDNVQLQCSSYIVEVAKMFLCDDSTILISSTEDKDSKDSMTDPTYDSLKIPNEYEQVYWHCGTPQQNIPVGEYIFAVAGDADKAVRAGGDDLSYLSVMSNATEIHMIDGLLYQCLPWCSIKARKKVWYGKDVPQGWEKPTTQIIYPNLGIGDILITKALLGERKIQWHLDTMLVQKYRNNTSGYMSLVNSLLRELNVTFSWIPQGITQHDDPVILARKYQLDKNRLNRYFESKSMLAEEYIIFHTKSRLDDSKSLLDIEKIKTFMTTYKSNRTIVLMGEREIDDNKENITHGVVSLYEHLVKLKANNKVIDLTVPNIQKECDFKQLCQDIAIIRKAHLSVNFGYGGNFVLSTLFCPKTVTFIGNLQHTYFNLINNEGLYRDLSSMLASLPSREGKYIPKGERGLIERWTAINARENVKSYSPQCRICGYESKRNDFVTVVAQDIFHGGQLIRYKCSQCGLIFGPFKMLNLSEEEFIHDWQDLLHHCGSQDNMAMNEDLFMKLAPNKEKKYLLYGCYGEAAVKVLRNRGYDVYGFNPYGEATPFLFNKREALKGNLFDSIFSNNFIDKTRDPVGDFTRMRDVLTEGGKMIHASPCFDYVAAESRYNIYFYIGNSMHFLCDRVGLKLEIIRNTSLAGIATSYAIFTKDAKSQGQWNPTMTLTNLQNMHRSKYAPRGEKGLIERWTYINAKEDSILKNYSPQCRICGYSGKSSDFKVMVAQDAFHAGQLIRYTCPRCGVIFGPRKMLELDEEEFAHDYIDLYSYYKEGNTAPIEIGLITGLNPNKKDKYLLYGCRNDDVIKHFRDQGYNVYGFDPYGDESPLIIRTYEELYQHKFAGIASNDLLEHLKDPVKEIKIMSSILHDGGTMMHATACYRYAIEFTHYHLYFFVGKSIDYICHLTGLQGKVTLDTVIGGISTSCATFTKPTPTPETKINDVVRTLFTNLHNGVAIEYGTSYMRYFEDNLQWKVINVEPVMYSYIKLCENRPKSINVNYALSDSEGKGEYTQMIHPQLGQDFGRGSLKHSKKTLDELTAIPGMKSRTVMVEKRTFSGMVRELKLDKVDLLCVNTQGYEVEVLRGMKASTIKPHVLMVNCKHLGIDVISKEVEGDYLLKLTEGDYSFFIQKEKPEEKKSASGMDSKDNEAKDKRITMERGYYIFECPHCGGGIEVLPQHVACAIFRHAVYKHNNEPVQPHMSKDDCDKLLQAGLVRGCCRPLSVNLSTMLASACDYI